MNEFLIEYLCFEVCKPNNDSRFLKICIDDDSVFLSTAFGLRGTYIEDSVLTYQSSYESARLISGMLKDLKINTWPKVVPADYVPGDHLLGCDTDSWSLDYKEKGKKRTRHIRGKGSLPDYSPYNDFLECIDQIAPGNDWIEWIGKD